MGPWIEVKANILDSTSQQPWWTLYHDKTLNALEAQLTCDNFDLKIAFARFQEARAIAEVTRSALYPQATGIGTVTRQKISGGIANAEFTPDLLYNTFLLTAYFNYEVDAWGRVRNAVVASDSRARASRFDLDAIALSMHAELAADYFELRGDDEAQRVLDATVVAYKKSLYLVQQRHKEGMVPAATVDEAIALLENAKTQATEMRLKRAQLEHAIAVLLGEIPANFSLKAAIVPFKPVVIAPDMPSTLLTRRPDIGTAMQLVQAANAQIGVARAAFLPQINLVSLIGAQSRTLSSFFTKPSFFWSLGPSSAVSLVQPEVSQVIFDGFKLVGLLKNAKASYFEAANTYRKTVLNAFREVEDELVAIRRLEEEYRTQSASTSAAKRALYQANRRYAEGLVTYINVVVYENQALQSELALVFLKTRRQLASVRLIRALGGGWNYCPKYVHKRQ